MCSRPRPALVRVAFDVHLGYHTRYSGSGDVSSSSAFSSLDCTAAKDVAVDTPEIVCLSSEDAATCCAAIDNSDLTGFYRGITDSLYRCPLWRAWLARLGRGRGLPAATLDVITATPCYFTMDSEGVRCWYWILNRDAMTNAAILGLQLHGLLAPPL